MPRTLDSELPGDHENSKIRLEMPKIAHSWDFRIDFGQIAALIGLRSFSIPNPMSEQPTESSVPLAEISQGPNAFEAFLDRNQKLMLFLALLLIVGAATYIVVRGIEKSQQETAGAALVDAKDAAELQKVIEEHGDTQAAKSAMILLADQQWQQGDQDDAIATLESFLASYPEHPAAPTATASLASKWMAQGKIAEATDTFQSLIDDPKARYIAPFALISLGDIARNDNAKAEDYYSRVQSEHSESYFVRIASQRLADLKAKPPMLVEPAPEPEAPAPAPAPEISESGDITLDPTQLSNAPNPLNPPLDTPADKENSSGE